MKKKKSSLVKKIKNPPSRPMPKKISNQDRIKAKLCSIEGIIYY
jgi:hypothetical protein